MEDLFDTGNENSSCSMGFFTQAPNSAFLKASHNRFLAVWNAVDFDLASQYCPRSASATASTSGLSFSEVANLRNRLKKDIFASLEAVPFSWKRTLLLS